MLAVMIFSKLQASLIISQYLELVSSRFASSGFDQVLMEEDVTLEYA